MHPVGTCHLTGTAEDNSQPTELDDNSGTVFPHNKDKQKEGCTDERLSLSPPLPIQWQNFIPEPTKSSASPLPLLRFIECSHSSFILTYFSYTIGDISNSSASEYHRARRIRFDPRLSQTARHVPR